MVLELKQEVRLSQTLLMTPQLQQAIKLLQLSRLEVSDYITRELEENPVLEEVTKPEADGSEQLLSIDGPSVMEASQSGTRSEFSQPSSLEQYVSSSPSLAEILLSQLGELNVPEKDQAIAIHIIGNLSEVGFFELDVSECCAAEGFDEVDFLRVLALVQSLEPAGIAARGLEDSLLIQLHRLPKRDEIAELLIKNHLGDFSSRKLELFCKANGLERSRLKEALGLIERLQPYPGRVFSLDATQYITPDVYVYREGQRWGITMNEDGIPRLGLNDYYLRQMEKARDSKETSYLQERARAASWLIRSLDQRQRTIYRVAEKILEKQIGFFERGVLELKPMVLKDIAEDLQVHESTVSRVTNNKYIQTPRGVFELKYFFTNSIANSDNGSDLSSEAVRAAMKQIIRAESPQAPYSDSKIAALLGEEGIDLARRTVAKYREKMGIAPARERKQHSF